MYAVQRLVLDKNQIVGKEVKVFENDALGRVFKQLRKLYCSWQVVTDCLTKEHKEFAAINPEDGQEIRFEFEPIDRAHIYRKPR